MRVLITGAMGHVGSNAVRAFRVRGHEVVALYHSRFDPDVAAAFAAGASFLQSDLADFAHLVDILRSREVEAILHTAALPYDGPCRRAPLTATRVNVLATQHVLEAARLLRLRRVVYVSTGSVFQKWPDPDRVIPESEPASPSNVYATTKRMGELLVNCYAETFGVSACSARVSWVYGPPLYTPTLEVNRGPIPYWLCAALLGRPVEEPSGGDFRANFTYVDDVAEALLRLVDAPTLRHTLYQVSTGEHASCAEVIAAIRAEAPEARLTIGPGTAPYTDHTPMRGSFSITRLREDTGFAPAYPIRKGIAAYAEWLRQEIHRRGRRPT
jgi:nucleoside-diphosphate-sugar epimerase